MRNIFSNLLNSVKYTERACTTALVSAASRPKASEVEEGSVGERHGGRPLVGQGDEDRRVKCLASAL